MKPLLILATNPGNDSGDEDLVVGAALRTHFRVAIFHPLDSRCLLGQSSGVLIRNVWPTHTYQRQFVAWVRGLLQARHPTYNPLVGRADARGKGYLVTLTRLNYPVVPTFVAMPELLSRVPHVTRVLCKPVFGADGSGQRLIGRNDVLQPGELLQPFLNIREEVSLYYLDDSLLYALRTPSRLDPDEPPQPYDPSSDERTLGAKFVDWNKLPFGLQRVDLCRTLRGELLLLELEDLCPYLWLAELSISEERRVLSALSKSVAKHLTRPRSPEKNRRVRDFA